MSLRLVAITFDSDRPEEQAAFWAGLLDRDASPDEDGGLLLPGDPGQVGLRFEAATTPPPGPNRVHLHVTTQDPDDEAATIQRALDLGGRHLDVGQLPEEDHTVLADPAGDPFCVIGPGNRFLAGCGRLGEVSCDGTRAVGLFWRDALGWPLVWDENEETAVQSPDGGTKVAWGGPPLAEKHGRSRQRPHLAADDLEREVERLVELGASVLERRVSSAELADPDGNELLLVQA
jgi:hypothetical protein